MLYNNLTSTDMLYNIYNFLESRPLPVGDVAKRFSRRPWYYCEGIEYVTYCLQIGLSCKNHKRNLA